MIATPIGNLADMTYRAVQCLSRLDLLLVEDTREAHKLLAAYAIKVPVQPYHDHNAHTRRPAILRRLLQGQHIGLTSDAGTPLISDPGYRLVREARALEIRVVVLPGPCAPVAALSVAGLPTDAFWFGGFLPVGEANVLKRLEPVQHLPASLIWFVPARHVSVALAQLAGYLGEEREACIAREMTKIHEEYIHGRLGELRDLTRSQAFKGEVTLIIGPPDAPPRWPERDLQHAIRTRGSQSSPGQLARILARESGWSRQRLYQKILDQQKLSDQTPSE